MSAIRAERQMRRSVQVVNKAWDAAYRELPGNFKHVKPSTIGKKPFHGMAEYQAGWVSVDVCLPSTRRRVRVMYEDSERALLHYERGIFFAKLRGECYEVEQPKWWYQS